VPGVEATVVPIRQGDLGQIRDTLREIDVAVHNLWNSGQNLVVGWMPEDTGISVCMAPSRAVLAQAADSPRLLDGSRLMDETTFAGLCKELQARVLHLPLPMKIGGEAGEIEPATIDRVVRRYAIFRTAHRALMLFDLVDFSGASPLEQVAQFIALEHSISAAADTMAKAGLHVDLARSTAGDGSLYVWNRRTGLEADLRAYAAMLLILADNALAHRTAGAQSRLVPTLRTSFTVGCHYSYHPVEANRPYTTEYASGPVTITLARQVSKALAGQIVIGSFERPLESGDNIDAVLFVARAEKLLARLTGAPVDEHAVQEMRSLLSGGVFAERDYTILKYLIEDKHGFQHDVFNLRVKISCDGAEPIELGLRTTQLGGFAARTVPYEIPFRR
jgi:hypothetical protein